MKIGILINEGPYQHQASDTALQFTKSAIKKGHEIFRVFFYNDGVNNATRLAIPPQDDRNLTKEWSDLASEHNIDLVVHGFADDADFEKQKEFFKDPIRLHKFQRIGYSHTNSTTRIIHNIKSRT